MSSVTTSDYSDVGRDNQQSCYIPWVKKVL
jgi:hypothetical protein